MKKKIQVKGTLPLVADFLGAEEKKIYSIFNLDLKKEETDVVRSTKTKGEKYGTANKGKTLQAPTNSV